ncbi:MAG: amidohydrolase [Chitinophagaceae bacterium]|nr:amidohydrolase [Chitinophagaceae bacterium]
MANLQVALIQTNLHWENKQANIRMFEEKIANAAVKGGLVVLPEMFSTGFSMNPKEFAERMDGPTVTWMKFIAAKHSIILTGSLIIEEEERFFNRLIWMLPTGQYGIYDKRHLFAFAEEDQHYTAGKNRFIASVNGWRINLQVCFDLRFPVWARQRPSVDESGSRGDSEYDLLVYVANWPERRNHAWKTLLQARAIENQCYVVGVNRVGDDGNGIPHSGDSMIVDPMGAIIKTSTNEEAILTAQLDQQLLADIRSKLPFLRDADKFLIEP